MPADPIPTPQVPGFRGAPVTPGVPALTTDAHPESPKAPTPAWRGLLIKVPESGSLMDLRKPPVVRVFYRVPRSQWPKDKVFELVLIEAAGRKETRHGLGMKESSPMIQPPDLPKRPVDPRVAERLVIEGYLNINLVLTVRPPLRPGTYDVRLELGALRTIDGRIVITP